MECNQSLFTSLDLWIHFCFFPESFLEFAFLQHCSVCTLPAFRFYLGIISAVQDTGSLETRSSTSLWQSPKWCIKGKGHMLVIVYCSPWLCCIPPTPLPLSSEFGNLGLRWNEDKGFVFKGTRECQTLLGVEILHFKLSIWNNLL